MISIGWAGTGGNAHSKPIQIRPLESLSELVALAQCYSTSKSELGMTPGLPISAAPTEGHEINRSRDNMHAASVLAVDVDGGPEAAWDALVGLLTDLGIGFAAADSYSHAAKALEQPGLVWRHLFVLLERPADSAEYGASWLEFEKVLIDCGLTGVDRSKRQIENVIYFGQPPGVRGYGIAVEGSGWAVTQPKPEEMRIFSGPTGQTSEERARAYLACIEDAVGEPDFCAKICRLKKACPDAATFRALAYELALRSVSLKGNRLTDRDHDDATLDKIESAVRNEQIPFASLPDRQREPFQWGRAGGSATVPIPEGRTPIPVHQHEIAVEMACEQLAKKPNLYRRGEEVVMIGKNGEVSRLHRMRVHTLIVMNLSFVQFGQDQEIKHANANARLCDLIGSDLPNVLRPLDLVCHGPVLGIDGPGYQETKVGGVLSLPWDRGTPSQDWAPGEALAAFMDTFSFASKEDRAMAIAMLATIIARPQIEGSTPLFLITGSSSGSGKTLLATTLFEIADGRPAYGITPSLRAEEREKRLTIAMGQAPRGLHFENIATGSQVRDELLTTLTSQAWYRGRILGTGDDLICRQSAVVVAEGNNLGIAGDLRRRTAPIVLRPRGLWARGNELTMAAFIAANRGAIVDDVLRILQTKCDEHLICSGYEDWSRVVRTPIAKCLGVDPWESRRLLEDIDEDHGELEFAALILESAGAIQSAMTARQIIQAGENNLELRLALEEFLGISIADAPTAARHLGSRLKKLRGRSVGAQSIVMEVRRGRGSWRLLGASEPESTPDPSPSPSPAPGGQREPQAGDSGSAPASPSPSDWSADLGGYTMPEEADAPIPPAAPIPAAPVQEKPWAMLARAPLALVARGGPGSVGLVDGTGTVCRGYFAAPDIPSTGLSELVREVERLRSAKFERIVVIADARERTRDHRRDLDPQYKANRRDKPKPEHLIDQLNMIEATCRALGCEFDCDPGVEADDLIAHYAMIMEGTQVQITVVTQDKDLSMMVGDFGGVSIRCWSMAHGLVDADAVRKKWGVDPERLGTLFSLIGDPSDGISGVEGIGQVIGSRIVDAYGSLGEIMKAAHAGTIETERIARRLVEQADRAFLSAQLVALRPDMVSPVRQQPLEDPIRPLDLRWLEDRLII